MCWFLSKPCFWKTLYKSPPEASFSIGRREREREMICTLKSDFKIQKSREKWNFKNPMVHTRRSLKRGIYTARY